jgi:AmmeMemoRadiSam system protein B
MRAPAVAGRFYSGNSGSLHTEVERSFLHEFGPGKVPKLGTDRNIKGVVAPHAGFVYSGPVAAHSYGAIAADGFPETFVIIGPNHSGIGKGVALTTETFKTPMGDVPVDQDLAEEIIKGVLKNDRMAHKQEHSLEVQLPFLQFIKKDFRIVPITMADQSFKSSKELGEILGNACTGKDVVVVASTDFTHCGYMYSQFIPSGQSAGEYATKKDEKAIAHILDLDPQGLVNTVKKNKITMCGYGCVAAMIYAAKAMGATKSELLQYKTSYDIEPSDNAVGYGSIVLK